MHAGLDHGARLLEQLPRPEHLANHFVFDQTKWAFYAASRSDPGSPGRRYGNRDPRQTGVYGGEDHR